MLFRRRSRAPTRRRIRKLRTLALLCVLGFVALVSFAYGLVSAIASDVAALEPSTNKRPQQLGYVYASDGKTVLATLRGDESRIVVSSDKISPIMKQAIVAVEDHRFWEHPGVDYRGILRAVWADIRHKAYLAGPVNRGSRQQGFAEIHGCVEIELLGAQLCIEARRAVA